MNGQWIFTRLDIFRKLKFSVAAFQVLVLEPSKLLQPAIVCVSEEDESRTVQLKHVTTVKVCRPSNPIPPHTHPHTQPQTSLLSQHIFTSTCLPHIMLNKLKSNRKNRRLAHFMIQWMFNQVSTWVCSLTDFHTCWLSLSLSGCIYMQIKAVFVLCF